MGAGVATSAKPRDFNGLKGALARAAVEHDPLGGIARQLRGVEARERHGERARDMARRVFIRLTHVDERDRSVGQAFLEFLARNQFDHCFSPKP
jgi:hypothetical protein